MHRFVSNIALLILALQLTSCAPSPEAPVVTPAEPATKDSAPSEYQVRGVIKEIPETGNSLRIHHEEIPGYMQAMTMPFSVKDRAEFADLELEQTISFTLHVTETESWIDQIQAAKSTLTPGQMPSIESFRQVRDVEPLEVGDTMTNYPFTNQNNEAIQLDDFRGEVLVLTFIYTRCPLPDFCPRMSMHFRAAHDAIQKEDNTPENWHFLSITFDPEYDTPDVLKNYSKAYAGDSKKWSFATGEIIEIDAITEQFGLMFSRSQVSITDWDHNLRTVIIDPQGTIHKIYIGNTWTPDDLVQDLKQAALKGQSTTRAAIEDAIETTDSSATVVAEKPSLNAVDYYQKAHAIAETLDESDSRRIRSKTIDQEAPRLLQQLEEAIDLVRTGAAIKTALWPSDENNPSQSILLGKIVRSCSAMLVYTALNELEQGKTEQAISDLISSLAVARHASVKPTMMVKLIEIGASRRASDTLAKHLPNLPRELVVKIQEQLKQLPPSPSVAEVIRKEYQFGILEAARQDKQTGRQDHFSERQFTELKDFYAALADAASLPPEKFETAINDQTSKYSENFFAPTLGKVLQSFQKTGSVSLTRRALLETGIQIVLTGERAASDSKDPHGEGPFTYQKHQNGFELSSQLIDRGKPVSMSFGLASTNP